MKKIKIAQIGMAHDHAGVTFSALSKIDDFDVVGYCTVPEDESEYASQQQKIKSNEEYFKNAKRYTVEEILSMPDLDAVVIETFDLNLVKYAKMAAERGLHVQMDKAPGESAKEYEELLSIIKSKNLAFSIGYMYRFNPFIKSVYEKVFSGEIGKVHTVDAEMSCYMNTNKRIWLEQFKGGMMQFLGCHLVDLVVQLMGVPTEIIPYNFSTGANNVDSLDVERGLHVQMDKAPGESAKEYEELLSIIKSKNLAFSIGYMYRFNPFIKSVYEKVFSGEIGKVHTVDAEMSCYMNTNKRIWLEQFKGGMMQFLGCHLVDLVVQLMGVPTEIIPYNFSTGANNVDSLDVAFSVFKYKNALATIKSSVIDCGGYVRRHLTISTNNKTIDIRPLEKLEVAPSIISTKMTEYCHEKGWHDLGITSDTGAFDRYEAMLLNFAKMIRGEVGYVIDLETEARIHRCLLSACGIDCDYKGEIKI